MSDDSLFPAPWRGTCDVIVRRHPQDGYLFEITSTDLERAERADTLHMLARIKQGGARTVSLPAALPVVRVLQGLNLTVDDRVLRVDTWARHWGTALGLVLASMFVAAVATENVYPLIAFGLLTSFFGGACSDISRNAPRVSRRRSNGLRASEASSASSSTSSRADGRAGHTFGVLGVALCLVLCTAATALASALFMRSKAKRLACPSA